MNAVTYHLNRLTQAGYAIEQKNYRSFWFLPMDEAYAIMEDDSLRMAKTEEAFARLESTPEGRKKLLDAIEEVTGSRERAMRLVRESPQWKAAIEFLEKQ